MTIDSSPSQNPPISSPSNVVISPPYRLLPSIKDVIAIGDGTQSPLPLGHFSGEADSDRDLGDAASGSSDVSNVKMHSYQHGMDGIGPCSGLELPPSQS